jgi:hypothetical protein
MSSGFVDSPAVSGFNDLDSSRADIFQGGKLEILKDSVASRVVKTTPWHIKDINLSPRFSVLADFRAKYMPRSRFLGLSLVSR